MNAILHLIFVDRFNDIVGIIFVVGLLTNIFIANLHGRHSKRIWMKIFIDKWLTDRLLLIQCTVHSEALPA